MAEKKENGKIATQRLKQDSPKKGSVLFKATDPDGCFSSVYLNRGAATKLLGIPELNAVQEIEITVKVVSQ